MLPHSFGKKMSAMVPPTYGGACEVSQTANHFQKHSDHGRPCRSKCARQETCYLHSLYVLSTVGLGVSDNTYIEATCYSQCSHEVHHGKRKACYEV